VLLGLGIFNKLKNVRDELLSSMIIDELFLSVMMYNGVLSSDGKTAIQTVCTVAYFGLHTLNFH